VNVGESLEQWRGSATKQEAKPDERSQGNGQAPGDKRGTFVRPDDQPFPKQ
jgi:hypothetical protein